MQSITIPSYDLQTVSCDVCVVGGGTGGVVAALAAARQGAKTVLIEAKGYVGHEQGRYGAFNYFAVKEKDDYKRSAVNRFVSRYFGNCFSMVSQLVDDRQIDADELKRLLDIVEKRQSHD